jgi:hypothetical protein
MGLDLSSEEALNKLNEIFKKYSKVMKLLD